MTNEAIARFAISKGNTLKFLSNANLAMFGFTYRLTLKAHAGILTI